MEQSYCVTSFFNLKDWDVGFLLRHAVRLLSINKVGPVHLQNSERRMVLKGREDVGAGILPLVQEPNPSRDPNNSDHTEDDQDGQQRAGL